MSITVTQYHTYELNIKGYVKQLSLDELGHLYVAIKECLERASEAPWNKLCEVKPVTFRDILIRQPQSSVHIAYYNNEGRLQKVPTGTPWGFDIDYVNVEWCEVPR